MPNVSLSKLFLGVALAAFVRLPEAHATDQLTSGISARVYLQICKSDATKISCLAMPQPIHAKLAVFRMRGQVQSKIADVSSDRKGHIKVRLRPGRYSLQSLSPYSAINGENITVMPHRFSRLSLFVKYQGLGR